MTISIAELHASGIRLDAHEAVAIAQELIRALRGDHDADQPPPPGPPSADTVFLRDDGSVICRGCQVEPTALEMGIFLDALLPAGAPRVPGGLRYTIARALLNVDVPPFDSLDDFMRDLARHEGGPSAAIVRGLRARAAAGRHTGPAPQVASSPAPVDRRRSSSSAALRRELREADARLYESSSRGRTLPAAAACLAAGLALVATGELMHHRAARPIAATQSVPSPAPPSAAPQTTGAELPRGVIRVRPDERRVAVKPVTRRAAPPTLRRVANTRPVGRAQSKRGVLDRLRLGWLRTAFSVRSDL